jgi:hypothetical protein
VFYDPLYVPRFCPYPGKETDYYPYVYPFYCCVAH